MKYWCWPAYVIAFLVMFAAPGYAQSEQYPVTLSNGVTAFVDTIDLVGGPWAGYTLAQDLNVISMEGERLAPCRSSRHCLR